jgi:hypothetical protein
MHASRAIQTILQAAIVLLLAAMVFRKPPPKNPSNNDGGPAAPAPPSTAAIVQAYKSYFQEHADVGRKAELLSVLVRAVSVDGPVARVKLRICFQWLDQNPDYADGPLRHAPGQKGDRVEFTETFEFRLWNTGWDIEGRTEPTDIR